uniref:hypothetical protein n=1 Tax=Sphingomonas sp. CCH20-B6 TaxID=1768769 RepID=UPI001E2AABB1
GVGCDVIEAVGRQTIPLRTYQFHDFLVAMTFRGSKWVVLGSIALIAFAAALFFAWLAGGPYTKTWPTKFDAARWKASSATWSGPDARADTVRCGMLLDLTFRIGIGGRRHSELIQMLGVPAGDSASGFWTLCPNFMDHWILEVDWRDGRASNPRVRDS